MDNRLEEQLTHNRPASATPCPTSLFIEPMQWMTRDAAFPRAADGKLLCPTCRAKLGSWNWRGTKYVRCEDPSLATENQQGGRLCL